MTKRLSFLLLDANIVIYLFKLGIWQPLIAACDIHLARTVKHEAHFYEDDNGQRHDFDLEVYEANGSITVFDVAAADVEAFRTSFDPTYLEKLDDGEAESLAHLVSARDETLICSADAIVFRVLANLDRSAQGLSLEEVLQRCGLARRLPTQFTRRFRDHWTKKGVEERLYGMGVKS